MYSVKELFYTLQGEGVNAGRAAVFCRFAGCNLWNGREQDRIEAICRFCDTDFVGTDGPGGSRYETAEGLARAARACWPHNGTTSLRPLLVCTGGEPLLQLDASAVVSFKTAGFEIAIETNGTVIPPSGLDWICVSPKADGDLILTSGDELKLVFPQLRGEPELYKDLQFRHFYLQPMDGPGFDRNLRLAVEYCLRNPQWRLSVQAHKLWGIP